MNVKLIIFSFILSICWSLPTNLLGQLIEFEEGSINVGFGTNIQNKSGDVVYFTNKKNPVLDFSGVEDPQIFVVLQNLKWKKNYDEGYYLVSKKDWIRESGSLLNQSGKAIKTKSKAKRKIYFKVDKNGSTTIKVDVGVLKPKDDNDLSKVGKLAGKTLTKTFIIKGIGKSEPVASTNPPKKEEKGSADPHTSKPVAKEEQNLLHHKQHLQQQILHLTLLLQLLQLHSRM